jgi:DNA-damage-inducible protein D
MTEESLFHFEKSSPSFEDLAITNGANHWKQSDLMNALGYQTPDAFRKVVNKAMQACLSLNIPTEDNFVRQPDGEYLFTRFACYLIAMNGDSKRAQVAGAQIYFAKLAETFNNAFEHADAIDRVLIRDEVSEGEKSLSSTAKQHGVVKYGFFQNAGYRGMYNMNLGRLKEHKGVGERESLIDRMGKSELAAHLFRITQTDEKIRKDGIQGQRHLEEIAERVGKQVRRSMLEISGQKPENLPAADPINEVKKRLKATDKQFRRIDDRSAED